MNDAALIARVGDVGDKLVGQPKPPFRLSQKHHAPVRGQPATIERRPHFLAVNRWEREVWCAINCHDRRGTFRRM